MTYVHAKITTFALLKAECALHHDAFAIIDGTMLREAGEAKRTVHEMNLDYWPPHITRPNAKVGIATT